MTDRPITHEMPACTTICCVGDSITAGCFDEEGLSWSVRLNQLLVKEYPRQYMTQKCGISGNTVFDAWHNIRFWAEQVGMGKLFILVGVNDTCISEGVEPETFQISLGDAMNKWVKILDHVKRFDFDTYIISPLPVAEKVVRFKSWDFNDPRQTSFRWEQDSIKLYNENLNHICETRDIPFLNLFQIWMALDNLPSYYADGLHPNAKGHQLLAEQVFAYLKDAGI